MELNIYRDTSSSESPSDYEVCAPSMDMDEHILNPVVGHKRKLSNTPKRMETGLSMEPENDKEPGPIWTRWRNSSNLDRHVNTYPQSIPHNGLGTRGVSATLGSYSAQLKPALDSVNSMLKLSPEPQVPVRQDQSMTSMDTDLFSNSIGVPQESGSMDTKEKTFYS